MTPKPLMPSHMVSRLPFYQTPAACGFASPAADYLQETLSLDQLLIQHQAATFFARARGNSMEGAGIFDDDILIIDRSLTASHGDIILALLDGELIVKRLHHKNGKVMLQSENSAYPPILLDSEQSLHIWGVVTNVIHNLR